MVGAHQAFAAVADAARKARLAHRTLDIGIGVGRVDRFDAGRAAFEHEAAPRVIELDGIAPALGHQVGSEVFDAEQRSAYARAGGRHLAHVDYAKRGFAHRQDAGAAGSHAAQLLAPCDFDIQRAHVVGARGLRIGDDVGARRNHHVKVSEPSCIELVDAHGHHRAGGAPHRIQVSSEHARFVATCRRREVFEVLDQHVGTGMRGGLVCGGIGAGYKQPGTAQVNRSMGHVRHKKAGTTIVRISAGGAMIFRTQRTKSRSLMPPGSSRNHPGRQRQAMVGNVAGPHPPGLFGLWMADAMLQGTAQHAQPERLPEHVGVHRDVHH